MAEPLKGTASAANAIARVKYSHDAMIDMIIANPAISQGMLAANFGYTQAWVSQVINSDAFQARLAMRKEELVDPGILASIEERFKGLIHQSVTVIGDKLAATQNADLALGTLAVMTKAMGYGARPEKSVNVQNNFIVQVPVKAATADDWAKECGRVIENGQ